jgi:hypothetical protein
MQDLALKKAFIKCAVSLKMLSKIESSDWHQVPIFTLLETLKPQPKINSEVKENKLNLSIRLNNPNMSKIPYHYLNIILKNDRVKKGESIVAKKQIRAH